MKKKQGMNKNKINGLFDFALVQIKKKQNEKKREAKNEIKMRNLPILMMAVVTTAMDKFGRYVLVNGMVNQ